MTGEKTATDSAATGAGEIDTALIWLRAALDCERFLWDGDQWQGANDTHKNAVEQLAASRDQLRAKDAEIERLTKAANEVLDLCMDGAANRFNTLNMSQVFNILDAAIRPRAAIKEQDHD